MSRLEVKTPGQAQAAVEQLCRNMERRIEKTAQVIVDTAGCAIGIDAVWLVLMGLKGFWDETTMRSTFSITAAAAV